MTLPRIAILDDDQSAALASADWDRLRPRADITVLQGPIPPADLAATLAPYAILVLMRERTAFPRALIEALPNLRMIALTGGRSPSLDLDACADRGIVVSNTGGAAVTASTAECAWMLLLACARHLPRATRSMDSGAWQHGVPLGATLEGKRLGIVGLGRLGRRVAGYGRAFGMDVVAWSQNLTAEAAAAAGATRVDKAELFATADAVSLHLVLSDRTRNIVAAPELAAMRPGTILVNTARGPLVDEPALLDALRSGRIAAGLDVFHTEPLPAGHPLRALPNVVLTPHLGYSVTPAFAQFYAESLDNIAAYLDGAPIRLITPT